MNAVTCRADASSAQLREVIKSLESTMASMDALFKDLTSKKALLGANNFVQEDYEKTI